MTKCPRGGYLGKVAVASIVAGLLTFGGVAYSPVLAANNTAGSGAGVAIGTGSNAPKNENVAIGKGAVISYSNGASTATGDIVVGNGASINNYASQGGSIAIGKNAIVENMTGKQESLFALGQTQYHSGNFLGTLQIPNNPENVAGSIALGDNTYARTGSIMIGSHNYRGLIGDQNVDTSKTKDYEIKTKDYGININATTLGTNSFNQGAFSSVTGAYSIISGKYNGSGFSSYGVQNFGATITGSLNSIESATSSSKYSGIANSIVGTANRASNSNGSLIFGAGNEILNSITNISSAPSSGGDSAQALQNTLLKAVQDSESGGATLAIGGGNKANYTQKTSIIGVNNKVVGEKSSISSYNSINGFKNTVTNASHVKVLGQGVTINKGADSNTVIGDYRTVADGQTHNVIIGNADEKAPLTTSHKETVILGFNANASFNGSVALGAGSLADTEAGIFGWDPGTQQASTLDSPVWKSSWAAVSVGDSTHTRQITRVAAGSADTDAVNVAQLKAAMENAAPKLELLAGDGIKIEKDSAGKRYTISANLTGGETATDSTKVEPKTEGTGSGSGDSQETVPGNGKPLEILAETKATKFAADEGSAAVKPSETLHVAGDGKNLSTKVEGNTLSVNLKKDLAVDSVTAGGTKLSSDGVTIAGGPSMTKDGLDAGSKKITNVAAGTEETDGVNYGQLKGVENRVEENTRNINQVNGRVSKLDSRLNKVGAGAAALAALHPQDFNPDDKWDFAVGFGNYRDANAMALGAFYRPDDRTMFSVAGNFGNGENMINAGMSFKLGKNSPYAGMDRQAMIHRLASQDRELEAQNQRIAKLEQLVAQLMAK